MDVKALNTNLFNWTTPDGLKIHAKDWHVAKAKAAIIIIHGLGEHCERYAHMAAFFNKNNIGFVGYDRRGHGHSEGKRGHTTDYQAFLTEVEELLKNTRNFYPDTPIFIYGHSMGGNIALNYVLNQKPKISGLILSGAWIVLFENPSPLLVAFAKVINKIYPTYTQENGLDPINISTVATEVEKYQNDPLVHSKITSNTGLEMMKAAAFLETYEGEMPIPTLMMHGGGDKIISPVGSREFSKRVKGDIMYKEWDGLFHEIHNDAKNLELFRFTLDWINNILER